MLPYIEVKGTHRQIGQAIGEETRNEVASALKMHFGRLHQRKLKKQNAAIKKLTSTVEKFFPDYIEEVKGIGDGANQPFEQLLLFSFEEELSPGEKCSSLALKTKNNIFFAHNEDWDLGLPLYMVKAKPKGKPAFISLANAGQFCGTVVGMNEYGFVYGGNSINTKLDFNGLPKVYCLRSFLECKTISDAVKIISKAKRAIGNNSVLVSRKQMSVATLEWSPQKFILKKCDKVAHTNHFITKEMSAHQTTSTSRSSKARYDFLKTTLEKNEGMSLKEIKNIMSTHINSNFAICQHGTYVTLASVIVDVNKRVFFVSHGNPCRHKYLKYEL